MNEVLVFNPVSLLNGFLLICGVVGAFYATFTLLFKRPLKRLAIEAVEESVNGLHTIPPAVRDLRHEVDILRDDVREIKRQSDNLLSRIGSVENHLDRHDLKHDIIEQQIVDALTRQGLKPPDGWSKT